MSFRNAPKLSEKTHLGVVRSQKEAGRKCKERSMKQSLQVRRKASRLNMHRPHTDPTNGSTNDPRDLIVSHRCFESAQNPRNIAEKYQGKRIPIPNVKHRGGSNNEDLTSRTNIDTVRAAYALHSVEDDARQIAQLDRRSLPIKNRPTRLKANLTIAKHDCSHQNSGRVSTPNQVHLKVTSSSLQTSAVPVSQPQSQRTSASLPSLQYRIAQYLKNKKIKVCSKVIW